MIANIALDYTEWAPPLSTDAVLHDINVYRAQHFRTPSKIIMWVHQWGYLTNKYDVAKPAYILTEAEANFVIARPAKSSDDGRLFGIQVEVRDPEAHKP